jgi:uncharacterized membrane protein YbhN (UPF0104 family)
MGWLKQALTGANNETVAIGRLIGFAIAVVLLIGLPVIAAATVIHRAVPVEEWRGFFEALGFYVPLIVGAITGLIWGTNTTEPKPVRKEGNENG